MALWKQMSIILILGITFDLSNSYPFGVGSLFSEISTKEQTSLQNEGENTITTSEISSFTDETTQSPSGFLIHHQKKRESTEKDGISLNTTTGATTEINKHHKPKGHLFQSQESESETRDHTQSDVTRKRVRPVFPFPNLRSENENTRTSNPLKNTTDSFSDISEEEIEQPSLSHSRRTDKRQTDSFSQSINDEDTNTETKTAETTSAQPFSPLSPERPSFSHSVHGLNNRQTDFFRQSIKDEDTDTNTETAETTSARPFSPLSPERPSFSHSVHGLNKRQTDSFSQQINDADTNTITETAETTSTQPFSPLSPERPPFSHSVHGLNKRQTDFFSQPINGEDTNTNTETETAETTSVRPFSPLSPERPSFSHSVHGLNNRQTDFFRQSIKDEDTNTNTETETAETTSARPFSPLSPERPSFSHSVHGLNKRQTDSFSQPINDADTNTIIETAETTSTQPFSNLSPERPPFSHSVHGLNKRQTDSFGQPINDEDTDTNTETETAETTSLRPFSPLSPERPSFSHSVHGLNNRQTDFFRQSIKDEDTDTNTETETAETTSARPFFPLSPERPSFSHSVHGLNKRQTDSFSQPINDENTDTNTETETAETTSAQTFSPLSPERPSFSHSVHGLNNRQTDFFRQSIKDEDNDTNTETETAKTTSARPFSHLSPERPSFSHSVHGLNKRQTDSFSQPINDENTDTNTETETAETTSAQPFSPLSPERPSFSHSVHGLNNRQTDFFRQSIKDEDNDTNTETETAKTTSARPFSHLSPERPSFSHSVHGLNKRQTDSFSQPINDENTDTNTETETAETTSARPFSPLSPERPSFSHSVHGLNKRQTGFFGHPISPEYTDTTFNTDANGFDSEDQPSFPHYSQETFDSPVTELYNYKETDSTDDLSGFQPFSPSQSAGQFAYSQQLKQQEK